MKILSSLVLVFALFLLAGFGGARFGSSGSAPGLALESALERLLHLQYLSEHHLAEFEAELERKLAKDESSEPLDSASYKNLRALRALVETGTHDLLEAAENPENRAQILNWLGQLREADRLQLLNLTMELGEQPRSIGLETRFQSQAREIAAKARAAALIGDPELENIVAASGAGAESAPRALKITPSPGPDGNFIGTQLPPKTFVLTFDDGPGPQSTPRLHGVLKTHRDVINAKGAPASFFVLVQKALASPQVIAQTKRLGFPLNNHSWSHANFAKLDEASLKHEIVESTRELKRLFGSSFRFFRCPYGACFAPKIPLARELIAGQKLIHAYWSIDSLDWKNIGRPERTSELVIKEMRLAGRGLILMHDIHESTVDATKLILDWIKTENAAGAGYRLMTLEAAVDRVNRGN